MPVTPRGQTVKGKHFKVRWPCIPLISCFIHGKKFKIILGVSAGNEWGIVLATPI